MVGIFFVEYSHRKYELAVNTKTGVLGVFVKMNVGVGERQGQLTTRLTQFNFGISVSIF